MQLAFGSETLFFSFSKKFTSLCKMSVYKRHAIERTKMEELLGHETRTP